MSFNWAKEACRSSTMEFMGMDDMDGARRVSDWEGTNQSSRWERARWDP